MCQNKREERNSETKYRWEIVQQKSFLYLLFLSLSDPHEGKKGVVTNDKKISKKNATTTLAEPPNPV
jgi:hypothetical protein